MAEHATSLLPVSPHVQQVPHCSHLDLREALLWPSQAYGLVGQQAELSVIVACPDAAGPDAGNGPLAQAAQQDRDQL